MRGGIIGHNCLSQCVGIVGCDQHAFPVIMYLHFGSSASGCDNVFVRGYGLGYVEAEDLKIDGRVNQAMEWLNDFCHLIM